MVVPNTEDEPRVVEHERPQEHARIDDEWLHGIAA